jgi:DegV family protein with EDD domain
MIPTDIDGPLWRHLIIAGSQSVLHAQEHLNAINVFPVADADTGTNLALTLRGAAEGARGCADASIGGVAAAVADAALTSAHGCSGSIISQFFHGVSDGLRGNMVVDLRGLAAAVRNGAAVAREAVSDPQDGTILTVMRDWAEFLGTSGGDSTPVAKMLEDSLAVATASVRATTGILPALANAQVVDAGGLGFVVMLEGMVAFLRSGRIERAWPSRRDLGRQERQPAGPAAIEYRFCTRALISAPSIDRGALRRDLAALGDSQIVAGTETRVHVHIHSNDPERVFAVAQAYGEIVERRSEDIRAQQLKAHQRATTSRVALIADSACDLPQEETIRELIRIVPLRITFGSDSYLDKITLSDKDFYRLLARCPAPTTSQPTAAHFRDAYLDAAAHQREAIVVTVSAALSGTYQAAVAAADLVKDRIDVTVIDSKSVSVGIGLIVHEAGNAIAAGATLPDVLHRVRWAVDHVSVYATVETTEHLVRGGRLSPTRGRVARWLNIKPVLTLDRNGKVQVAGKALTAMGSRRQLIALIGRAVGERKLRCMIAHADAFEVATQYATDIGTRFVVADIPMVPMSAAFGAHAGPGAIAVAVLGDAGSPVEETVFT